MEMRFDIATNFDDDLLRRFGELGCVRAVYGKLSSDIVGGGRPSYALPKVSIKALKRHIDVAHENGISFNYLFNAICMDNRELIGKTNKKIRAFVKFVEDCGADSVTVGNPVLLGMVKQTCPDLGVSLSVYNDLDSLGKIKHWVDMGADEITLHYSYNRNFGKLEQVLRTFPDTDFRIIANNVCLHECPYRTNHACALGHSSQTKHSSGGFFLDWFSLTCGKEKLESPTKLISADWIRPEDVHYYEELCDKVGARNLTMKLADRARTTDWLANTAQAYAKKSYDGNLFDILNFIGNKKYAQVRKGSFVKGALMMKARADKMLEFKDTIFLTPIYADNKSLSGFMDHFANGYDCSQRVCDDGGWGIGHFERPPNSCGYCRQWAERVLSFPEGEDARVNAIEKSSGLKKDIEGGGMFSKK